MGAEAYTWLPGLGNRGVRDGDGQARLCDPADVPELLRLAQAAAAERRRVIFFFSCNSPFGAHECHRHYLVRDALFEAAQAERMRLEVQEWPGGALQADVLAVRKVPAEVLKKVRRGAPSVPLGYVSARFRFIMDRATEVQDLDV